MSRLRELRLHGFKSFADPTRFAFEPGVNAVIGPNGSGKSNMADAVRWVLGEQSNRSLRTRRADDVIFAGSDQRRAQGMAEAILTLDNGDGWLPIDFAEVSIGRRAYRSGESEYLINGARARLRDVVELLGEGRLGANELVVVGQGTVDAALSLRPEERRQLFEEAAGVKNLQVRKNESSVRLTRARDNLTRVADLVGELKPQVRRLALQAEHQQQHDALGVRVRSLVIESGNRRERVARTALGDARRAAAAAEAALEAHRGEQSSARHTVADAEARYWEAEAAARVASEAREATRETLIRAEARAEALSARRAELDARLERVDAELTRARNELATFSEAGGDAADDRLASALEAAAAAERAWRSAVDALAAADADLLAAEEALADVRRRESARIAAAARRTEQEAGEAARRERAAAERDAAVGRHDDARARLEGAVAGRRETEAALIEAGRALGAAADERDRAQTAADVAGRRAAELGERLMLLRAEESAIRDRADEGAHLGTILTRAGWAPLLDGLDAPEDAWPAIEAVVGGDLDLALQWRGQEVTALVAEARGAARLLDVAPVPEAPGEREAALRAVGGSRTLADWVGPGAPRAFHRAAVARDLPALIAGWQRLPTGWCAVTAFGDLADARGVALLRGRGDAPGGAAVRRHARRRELEADLKRTEAEHGAGTADAHRAAELLRVARDRHLAAREGHESAERAVRRTIEDQESAAASAERASRELDAIETELATLAQELPPGAPAEAPPVELQAAERRASVARARREASAADRDRARDAWNAASHAAQELEADAGRRRDRAVVDAAIAQLTAERTQGRHEAAAATESATAALAALEAARSADLTAGDERAARERDREARRAELLGLERSTAGASARLAELERAAQATAIEASRRDDALAALVRERELALDGLPEPMPRSTQDDPERDAELATMDDEDLAAELRRVRRTLSQIGSVNPFAVDEHREMRTRLDDLTRQDADLRAAIDATEELIARLEAEITERFDAAFQAIGQRFDEYCRLLFSGGSASLQLADDADGDAPGGIEIVVRPPGKRLQRLAMLSGGERALTGVALLFAMLTVNPVPFCILDEVDAALDEANIGRFAAALRRLAESIDFVVITHNRATIEVADTIYGVTMTDAAVSRVLSLRLADLPVEATA